MSVSVLIQWGTVAEWFGFGGEIVVALAILWELEEDRRFKFLSEASSEKMYEGRARIYQAFMEAKGDSAPAKSETLRQLIWANPAFKKECDAQILLFENLGLLAKYRLFGQRDFVGVFPHAVVSFWVMLQAYVKEREVRTGPWWAKNFRKLTCDSIGYVLEQELPRVRIHSASRSESEDMVIDERQLRLLRSEIRKTRVGPD